MGVSGFGPFDNDSALDFIDEFLDVESPARTIRATLAAVDGERYHDVDDVCHAWAACELVAIAASAGEGYDPDDVYYEAAARLRPNKKLIGACLGALPQILNNNSELSELVDAEQRVEVEANLARTRDRLEEGLTRDRLPRLKVPKIKALHGYAVPAGGRWLVALFDYTRLQVLDTVYDDQPVSVEDIVVDDAAVLFSCNYAGAVDHFPALGRFRPAGVLAEPYTFITTIGRSCLSGSGGGDFETSYWLNHGSKFTQSSYEAVREFPFCPTLFPEQFTELVERYVTDGRIEPPPVPTPAELRKQYIDGCRKEWAPYLAGEGGGPFSFPKIYAYDVSRYVLFWIKNQLRAGRAGAGVCLPEELSKYFLAGLVAACVGAYPEEDVPDALAPLLAPLRRRVDAADVSAALHVLSLLVDETGVIPHVLQDDPPRRAAFLTEARAIRDALAGSR